MAQTQPPVDSSVVPELIAIVAQHGWPTNLGRMCVALKIGPEDDCKFKQISVSVTESESAGHHGFNVPMSDGGFPRYAIVFHLGPLIGNFFVVAPNGSIKASYFRAEGIDYTDIPNEEASRAFAISMEFWRHNLPALKDDIASGRGPHR